MRITGCAVGFLLVALMLQVGEGGEIDIEHVLVWPYSLTALCRISVVMTCRCELEGDLILVVVALVVATNTEEDAHLVVLQFCVSSRGIRMDEHLQMPVMTQVFVQVLIDSTCIACGKILHCQSQRTFILLCELRL